MKIKRIEKKEKDKKGQELTLSTIILIVLGIAVLVFLIWGFSTGWSNLWGKISAYFGGGSNVETIKNACTLACDSQSTYDYCSIKRNVKYYDDKNVITSSLLTCNEMETNSKVSGIVGLSNCGICPVSNVPAS